jgi:hypothetical protein
MTRRESAVLLVGIVAGWLAAVSAHLIAHRMAGSCVEMTVPNAPPPMPSALSPSGT